MNAVVAIEMAGRTLQAGLPQRLHRRELTAFWRRMGRIFCVILFSGVALLHFGFLLPFVDRRGRANWLHGWCRFACHVLGLGLTTKGSIPNSGLLVCNHLSYLDIIAVSAIRPCVFVAKSEVCGWPLFGWLARAAGTVFVQRTSRAATRREMIQIASVIRDGLLVVLFPEGTSSDGASVLPFKSALLQAAIDARCPIAAGAINYELRDGSVADEICYWRDMTLLPHLLNLCGKRSIESTVRFSASRSRAGDRKTLARDLQEEVVALRA